MCDTIFAEFDVAYDRRQICRRLEQEKFTIKVVEVHAAEQDSVLREQFRQTMRPPRLGGAFSSYHFVFLDETHSKTKDAIRRKGTSPRGQVIAFRAPFNRGGYSYSGIGAMALEGMIAGIVYDETVDADAVLNFIEFEVLPLMGRFPQPRSVLVLDNARPHCKTRIEQLCDAAGVIVIWLSPYSYDFNPIENAFKDTKQMLKSRFGLTEAEADFPHPDRLLFCLMHCFTPTIACNHLAHCHIEVTDEARAWACR